MSKNYPISLTSGQQIISIAGGAEGTNFITLAFDVPPSAGTVTIESRAVGDDAWAAISGFNNVAATSDKTIRIYGSISQLRITFSGLVGGSGASIWFATAAGEGFPPKVFEGHRALNVQGYVESNVKLGIQFYVQVSLPSLAAGQTYKMALRTDSVPVLIKAREFSARGDAVSIQVFKSPTISNTGTSVPIQNFNDVNMADTTCQFFKGVTTTADGTAWGDAQRLFGASATGQRVSGNLAPGGDRVLANNKDYLIVVTNTGSGSVDADYFLTWAEVIPDLPLP